jgi:hypothetical protein
VARVEFVSMLEPVLIKLKPRAKNGTIVRNRMVIVKMYRSVNKIKNR